MITFKAIVISNHKRVDGTYPVKIRVTFKQVSRRLATTLVATPNDLTRSLKIKSPTLQNKADIIIAQMRNAVSGLSPFDLEQWDVDDVVQVIKKTLTNETFHLDFFEWSESFLLTKNGKTRLTYKTSLNTFKRFLKGVTIDINDISRSLLLEFMDFVDNEPKMHYNFKTGEYTQSEKMKIARGASTRHIVNLQRIYDSAKDRYNDEDSGRILIPRSPFSTIKKYYPSASGQKSIGQETMQRVISAQVSDRPTRIALDIFVVSFGLMGANMADLYFATPFEGIWVYYRQKTRTRRADKAEMRVEIPDVLLPYIERLQESRGRWWLPDLHKLAGDKDVCTAKVNTCLKRWCRENDIPEFTFYGARHTWGTLARKAGVEKATIDDCLAHKGDYAMTDIYAEKSWDLMQEANRKVLDMFKW